MSLPKYFIFGQNIVAAAVAPAARLRSPWRLGAYIHKQFEQGFYLT